MTYSKIDVASHDTVTSALDLFKPPETKTSTLKGTTREVNPITDVDNAQIDFEFRTNNFNYWNPENTRLLVRAKVVKADGSDIEDTDNVKVAPVTNLLHTLFSIATLTINNNDIEYQANYPFAAYIESLLSRSVGYKKTIGGSSMWIEDSAGRLDRDDIDRTNSGAVKARKELISSSKTFELCDRIHLPFLNQERYVLPNTTIKLSLTRSSEKLCLLSTDATDTADYKIVITKCALLIHEIVINPSIINAQSSLLTSGQKVMYPLNQVETQMFTISAGKLSDRIVIKTNQQQPKRATFVFIDHEAKNGAISKDPFKFQHFDIRRISLDLDGQPIPAKPIETNFPAGLCARAYHDLAMATGKAFSDVDHGITMENFKNGYTVFMFDLTPDACEGAGAHLINFGSLTLEVTFGTALPSTVSLFAYLEREELLKFNNERVLEKLPRI